MNLIELIENAILTDEENSDDCSQIMINTYNECSDAEKMKIDKIFINLCGWSIKKLMEEIR